MSKQIVRTTLVFLFNESKILLGYKKRGFGQAKWNGFGGKICIGETITQAACRELKEECNIDVQENDLQLFALLQFDFEGEDRDIEINVFKTNTFNGEEMETEEMKPKWFDISEIPYSDMWADDRIWFPFMFDDKTFYAKFQFRGHETILDYKLDVVPVSEFKKLRY